MNAASIRIQLMSTNKIIQRDKATCYLQIIPNVTNIANIDKIEWKSGKNTIEYVLPINYKIIVKKGEAADIEQTNKIYYSCVDLLHSSVNSVHTVELGSGDISRIVSDNTFVQKFANKREETDKNLKTAPIKYFAQNCEPKYKAEKDEYSEKEATLVFEICKEKNLRERSFIYLRDNLLVEGDNKQKENLPFKAKKTVSVQIEISKEDLKKNKDEEIPSDQICALEANIEKPESVETLTNLNARFEMGSKLTMTSIISEWNNVTPLLKTVYQNTSFCNTHKQTFVITKRCTAKELTKELEQNSKTTENIISQNINSDYNSNPAKYKLNSELKVISALKLSNYIQLMEKEMLPLRIALNEIRNKCIPLCSLKTSQNSTDIYPQAYAMKKCYRQNQLSSNRGVYSVVFNK